MPADLHTHCEASHDSTLSFDDRLALAREHGLETVAFTDHVAVHERLTDPVHSVDGVDVVTGVEVNCTGEHGIVHLLGYYVDPDRTRAALEGASVHEPDDRGYEEWVERLHELGGAAVLAHPARYETDLDALVARLVDAGLDGIETTYPYVTRSNTTYTEPASIWRLADEYTLLRTGGTDCHGGEKTYMGSVDVSRDRVSALRRVADQY